MFRKVFSFVIALSLVAGLGMAMAVSSAPVQSAYTPLVARGSAPCFGVGSNNCCKEIGTAGIIGAMTGNEIAAGIAGLYYLYNC